jgi:hypothetical protein
LDLAFKYVGFAAPARTCTLVATLSVQIHGAVHTTGGCAAITLVAFAVALTLFLTAPEYFWREAVVNLSRSSQPESQILGGISPKGNQMMEETLQG